MTLPKLAALAVVALVVAGCQTVAERRAADEDKCLSYGFRRGTDAFAECLQRIDLDRRADARPAGYHIRLALAHDRRHHRRPVYLPPEERRPVQRCKIMPCSR